MAEYSVLYSCIDLSIELLRHLIHPEYGIFPLRERIRALNPFRIIHLHVFLHFGLYVTALRFDTMLVFSPLRY